MLPWKEKLASILTQRVDLSETEIDSFLELWQDGVELKRNDYLIKKGQVESHLFYVISGNLRIFYPKDNDEVCVGFAYDHNLICSYPSFILNQPSDYYLQALTKLKLAKINRSDFYQSLDKIPKLERCWRMITEEALLGKIEREVEMLTFSPEERYERLLERSPHVFQLIPKKYIASYLRMTPETLSRIK